MSDSNDFESFFGGQDINVSNLANTITNTFTMPGNVAEPTSNRRLLLGTAGIQAARAPAPDFIIPNNFLFSAGGSISFFGQNSGGYTALPTDGSLARIFGTSSNITNSPTNYAGQTGTIVVPEPMTLALCAIASAFALPRRRRA